MENYMDTISSKYKAIKKIKVPTWAEWESETAPTHLDKVKELVEQLPKGYRFYPQLIHNKLIKDRFFVNKKARRTREALQILEDWGMIKHDKKDRAYFVNRNGNKVKLYEVV
tara:strand:+ start:702 stop:1037 length:336 start_codon:yes stop_codon:yes gene_type:complete